MTDRSQSGQERGGRPLPVGRAWADRPLRAKGLVVIAIPLLALLLATVLFGVALAQNRKAQGAVLHTVEVEREIAQVRILVQAGVTGYVLTGERRYLTSYEHARQELPRAVGNLGDLVRDNPAQAARLERVRALTEERARILAALVANVQANRPPQSRAELLDQNKVTSDVVTAELQAMQDREQHVLADRQAQALRDAQAMVEHIVAWSPMVMFRGLLGGSGERWPGRAGRAVRAAAHRALHRGQPVQPAAGRADPRPPARGSG